MNDKWLAVVTPLILLLILVTFMQVLVIPRWIAIHQTGLAGTTPVANGLQVMDYNYNRDLVQISVAIWNMGSQPITITGVSYDGLALQKGVVGSPNDLVLMGNSSMVMPTTASGNSSTITIPNDIIFPASEHWNMYTQGPFEPVIQPAGMATLYLGVTSTSPGSAHTLIITSGAQQYSFQLQR